MRVRSGVSLFASVLLWVTLAAGAAADPAIVRLQQLQKALHDSHVAKDWQANLVAAMKQRELLNDSPDSRLEVARAEFFLGKTTPALDELTQYARMGQWADPAPLAPDGAALARDARFVRLQRAMEANRVPVARSAVAFVLSDPELLPEDIDYDVRTRVFYISSVRGKKIITADAHGADEEFARSPDGWPVIALKLDIGRERLWVTEVALQGYAFAPAADWGRSVLLCFDLKSHALLRRVEGPHAAALGDMVLSGGGDVIVSDGDGGGVYRLAVNGSTLERLDRGDFISPQTPALHPDGRRLFVPDYLRGIAILDLATHAVQWIPMGRFALNGIDGLYFTHGMLLATQNGTSPERVIAFHLDRSLQRVASEEIIERAGATLGDPTHGVVVGDDFYYIANSGWDVIDAHGTLKPGARVSNAHIMRIGLSQL